MYSQCLLSLFNSQFTLVSHGLGNSQILKLIHKFLRNTVIKGCSVRGLKEIKRLSEDIYKFVKKTTCVKYDFK